MLKKYMTFILFALIPFVSMMAKDDKTNQKEATEMFKKVYNMVFGQNGSSLTYSVNIIGLYKTQGDICYKGKKVYYMESRYAAWEDGVTAYMVDKKKQKVDIYRADDENKDEMLAKFKYDPKDFEFSYVTEGNFYLLTAKIKNASLFGIREVVAKLHKNNLHPVSLTIKLAILKTTVQITNFKAGGIDDSKFVFPRKSYANYKYTDHR